MLHSYAMGNLNQDKLFLVNGIYFFNANICIINQTLKCNINIKNERNPEKCRYVNYTSWKKRVVKVKTKKERKSPIKCKN